MKVFLSWSGDTSHQIAEKLYRWLPMVIQKIEPYISTEIEKGTRWGSDIAEELEKCTFGIACVTKENREAPWLLFEAGALSKSVSEGKLAPLLFGLEQSDIQRSPLTQFQLTKFERVEFFRLLETINDTLEAKLDSSVLSGLMDALWPSLEVDINNILSKAPSVPATSNSSIDAAKIMGAMEELLTNSRAVSQAVSRPERLLPESYLNHVLRRNDRISRSFSVRRIQMLLSESMHILNDAQSSLEEPAQTGIQRVIMLLEEIRHRIRDDDERLFRSPPRLPTDPNILERRPPQEEAPDQSD